MAGVIIVIVCVIFIISINNFGKNSGEYYGGNSRYNFQNYVDSEVDKYKTTPHVEDKPKCSESNLQNYVNDNVDKYNNYSK